MDDGWFGERNNDHTCPWVIGHQMTKKLPNGVAGTLQKVNDLGLAFGSDRAGNGQHG